MRYSVLSAAIAATVGSCALSFGAGIQKNDLAFGLSIASVNNNGGNSIDLVRGQPNGTNTGLTWTAPQIFIQSPQFDNLDGIKHNAKGNLVGLSFGATATGGTLVNLDTRFPATPGVATEFFNFTSYNAANPSAPLTVSRTGGLSISPNNQRLAFVGSDQGGAYVFDYTAGDTLGVGAAVTNGRQVLTQFRTLSTTGTTWLDNDRLLVADGNGFLKVVDASSATLSVSTVGTFALPGAGGNPFTSVVYEPTISPLVYVGLSQFVDPSTNNRLYAFDPQNSFAQVGSFDISGSSQSMRELAFDSRGDLYVTQFGTGTITASVDVFRGAHALANLSNNSSLDYYTSVGTASFNGQDIAISHPDYQTAGTTVNLRDNATAVEYFAASPIATIKARLATGYAGGSWNGTGIRSSVAAATPGTGIGYKELVAGNVVEDTFADGNVTVSRTSIYLAYTLLGDANVDFTVDIGDFSALAANFNTAGDWTKGDFNYDGVVDIGDFSVLAANFNRTLPGDAPRSSVPEPASALAAFGAAALFARRRRA